VSREAGALHPACISLTTTIVAIPDALPFQVVDISPSVGEPTDPPEPWGRTPPKTGCPTTPNIVGRVMSRPVSDPQRNPAREAKQGRTLAGSSCPTHVRGTPDIPRRAIAKLCPRGVRGGAGNFRPPITFTGGRHGSWSRSPERESRTRQRDRGTGQRPHFLVPNSPRGPLAYVSTLPLRNAGIAIKVRLFDAFNSLDPSKDIGTPCVGSPAPSRRVSLGAIWSRYTRRQP